LSQPRELFVLDARAAGRLLTDPGGLTHAARDAVAAGGGHVLDQALVEFPNGAVTLVLVLAESHLSIHTWPEEGTVAIDLFSCGSIDGARVVECLRAGLSLSGGALRRVDRGAGDG
jgi:S-adenosylmethionine decarboxylase